MSEETIPSLCERFHRNLKSNRSRNYQQHKFFPNGTAKKVFQINKTDLRALLRLTCERFDISTPPETDLLQRTLADFNNILAILIWSRGHPWDDILKQFLDLVCRSFGEDADGRPLITDESLPISRDHAQTLFPISWYNFHDEQFRFCAVTLMKREEVIYRDDRLQCPLPYLEQEEIGQGAFGRVFRVRIEQQHIESRLSNNVNREPTDYARKDFEVNRERAFLGEQRMLETILRQPRSNANVMVALASLQYGDTYSLFFQLASCDLWQYLSGAYDRTSPIPSGVQDRKAMYRRGVALAGGLAFLHHEFINQDMENMSCYHLDLKPHNVLVFDPYTSSEIWKITDFGLSRVRGRPTHGGVEEVLMTPALFRTRRFRKPPREVLTETRRGEGTYLAPECAQRHGQVSSASDVWSFGCIFSLVLTYLDGGAAAVEDFGLERRQQDVNDAFYTSSRNGHPQLSPFVVDWFSRLRRRARTNHGGIEFEAVRQTLDFLERRVFLIARPQRANATDVQNNLAAFSHLYDVRPPEPRRRSSVARILNHVLPSSSSSSDNIPCHKVPIDLANVRGSLFSPAGDALAFYSAQSIKAIPTDQILHAINRHKHVPDLVTIGAPRASWECIALSSRYLCGALTGECFECYIYPILPIVGLSATEKIPAVEGKRIHNPHLGAVKRVVMSKDGTLTAFALMPKPGRLRMGPTVYLAYSAELMEVPSDKNASPSHSRSNSAVSAGESENSALSGGNMIVEKSTITSLAHIRYLGFSNDGQYLIMVSQPEPQGLSIRVWNTQRGLLCADFPISIKGSSSSTEPLFTSCSSFHGEPSLVILCQRRFLIYVRSWSWDGKIHALPDKLPNMFNVFVREDNEYIFFLGDNGNDRRLRVYMMPITGYGGPSPRKIAMTDFTGFKTSLDTAMVTRNSQGHREMLIGTTKGPFLAIGLPENAPG
ncbi:hypothetical protein FE257_005908 [Aspergillus nanangensis]|uniref:Protein kinase domain-containing protein n=1 Tax=Aspergillus nanangensis TaxID=2582783 RepID=A0AAD4GWG9_ASPNN|nr:hypothetical protein FE257_005908 [Aspergillus nanangensis]